MINRIYATGYTGKDIIDLKPLVQRTNAILVDIRFTAHSEIMFWRRVYLKTLLGDKYLHVANLGNRNFNKGDQVSIQNLNLGIETLLSFNTSVILFCICAEPEHCHRRIIVEELSRRGIETTEIFDWKNPSLT